MRVAALYDIHGNLPALEAVLADPRFAEADAVVVGGDVVAGPQPAETLELLLTLGARADFIRGNADRCVAGTDEPDVFPAEVLEAVRWCSEQLDARQRAEVYAWPPTATLSVDGLGGVLFCHATPRSDTELVTPATPEGVVAEALAGVAAEVVVCGHIHVQYERVVEGRRLVNAGSVGLTNARPPGAYWALLGASRAPVELVRTDYDVERTIAAAEAAGYPLADFATSLREPPSGDETIAFFESARGA